MLIRQTDNYFSLRQVYCQVEHKSGGRSGRKSPYLSHFQTFCKAVVLCAVMLNVGCASPDHSHENTPDSSDYEGQSRSSSSRLTSPVIARNAELESQKTAVNKNIQQLSQGEATKIKTSNGVIVVEPTVVAPTDARLSETSSQQGDYNDPLEKFNRAMFVFNDKAYRYVLIPSAKGYKYIVPSVVRSKVTNAFNNISEPINVVTNLAAWEPRDAGRNLSRFIINSTVGLLGLFDPAKHWFNIEKADQSVGDTLAQYSVESGPYLVLPFLGQSDLRSAGSVVTEAFINPITLTVPSPESSYILGFGTFNSFSTQTDTYETLYKQAKDPYIYFRNQYIQGRNRDDLIERKKD